MSFSKLIFFISLVFSLPLHAAKYAISGIEGEPLKNVETRLVAISANAALPEEALKDQINKALEPYGYFKAQIALDKIQPDLLRIRIEPGPQMRIASLNVSLVGEGRENPELAGYLHQLPLQVGDPLLIKKYNAIKRHLLNSAENQGFLRSDFKKAEILVNKDAYTANITLIFDTGPLYYFGQVQFNPARISETLMHKYVPFRYDQPYSTDKILALNQQLSNSGYFSSVVVHPEIGQNTRVPVLVTTEPTPRYTYDYSLGYGTDTGVRGRAGMHIIPLNQQGHTLNYLAQGSMKQNLLQTQYLIPGNQPAIDNYSLTGSLSTLNYDSGYSNNLLFSASQNRNLLHYQHNLSINSLFERFHYTNQPNTQKNILFPKAVFTLKNTTSPLFSPSGYAVTFTALGADEKLLSALSFTQATVDAKAAIYLDPLRTRLYFHGIGGLTSTQNIDKLPLSLSLMLGGSQDLKAYSFNAIGPGKIMQYSGFEIQKETFASWYLTGFFDTGDVYDPDPRQRLYDIGAGLMWVSPVGPIKIGLAQAVNGHLERLAHTGPRLVINMGTDL